MGSTLNACVPLPSPKHWIQYSFLLKATMFVMLTAVKEKSSAAELYIYEQELCGKHMLFTHENVSLKFFRGKKPLRDQDSPTSHTGLETSQNSRLNPDSQSL